jgi:hypothetical protein
MTLPISSSLPPLFPSSFLISLNLIKFKPTNLPYPTYRHSYELDEVQESNWLPCFKDKIKDCQKTWPTNTKEFRVCVIRDMELCLDHTFPRMMAKTLGCLYYCLRYPGDVASCFEFCVASLSKENTPNPRSTQMSFIHRILKAKSGKYFLTTLPTPLSSLSLSLPN